MTYDADSLSDPVLASTRETAANSTGSLLKGCVAFVCLGLFFTAIVSGNGDAPWWGVLISWALVLLIAAIGVGLLFSIIGQVRGTTPWVELTAREARRRNVLGVQERIALAEVDHIAFLEGRRSTMEGPRGRFDQAPRGSRQRLSNELLIVGGGHTIHIYPGPGWQESIPVLASWAAQKPR